MLDVCYLHLHWILFISVETWLSGEQLTCGLNCSAFLTSSTSWPLSFLSTTENLSVSCDILPTGWPHLENTFILFDVLYEVLEHTAQYDQNRLHSLKIAAECSLLDALYHGMVGHWPEHARRWNVSLGKKVLCSDHQLAGSSPLC